MQKGDAVREIAADGSVHQCRLILSDMDNTILPKGEKTVSARTHEAFLKALSAGLPIGPSSGRARSWVPPMFSEDEACCATAVATNGLEVYLEGRCIHHEYFSHEALLGLLDVLGKHPGCGLLCFQDSRPYIVRGTKEELAQSFPAYAETADVRSTLPEGAITKVNVFQCGITRAETQELVDALNAEAEGFDFDLAFPGYLNAMPAGWNKGRGIKVLSLFFIDEVVKYRVYGANGEKENGEYAQMFEEEYRDILSHFQTELGAEDAAYQQYLSAITPAETHEGYFSIDKKGRMVDSKLKRKETSSDDSDAYDLIMRDKERLLDLDPRRSPVRFIFSHSALKEGWDNPNVFQICALRQTASTTYRKQEVGRGLRLCVNQAGERMDEARLGPLVQKVNILTVIAGESYAKYVDELQTDINKDLADRPRKVEASLFTGKTLASDDGKLPPRKVDADFAGKIFISLARHDYVDDDGALTEKYHTDAAAGTLQVAEAAMPYRAAICQVLATVYDGTYPGVEDDSKQNVTANVQEEKLAKKEFLGLWQRIHQKSVYTVAFDTEELVAKATAALDARLHVQPLAFRVKSGTLGEISSAEQLARGEAFVREVNGTEEKVVKAHAASGVRYDLLGKMAQATGLTRRTVAAILTRIREDTFANFAYHPEEFILKAAAIINEEKATAIIEHITYQPLEDVYETSIFTEAQAKGRLGANALPVEKSVFDYLIYDSENEREFARELESEKDVAVYVKLPSAFFIDTPVGHYNPDWAIAFREGSVKHIYFVAETKGSMESMELRAVEQAKISCAKKHFRAISGDAVRYDVVDSYEALRQLVACP